MFGTFWLFPWGNVAARLSGQEGLEALHNPIYNFDAKGVLLGAMVQILSLSVIIGISVLKPWGRRVVKGKSQQQNKPQSFRFTETLRRAMTELTPI